MKSMESLKIKDLEVGDVMFFFGRSIEILKIDEPPSDSPLPNGLLITFNHYAGPSTHFFPNRDAPVLSYAHNDDGDYDPFDD